MKLMPVVLVAIAAQRLAAQPGFPRDNPDSWVTAGTAKILCSALFVSGRDPAEARAHVTNYFIGNKVDSITMEVDRARQLVRVTLANRLTREAKRYGDQGCIIHQPGKDSIYFAPVKVTSNLPPAATMDWPMGDRNATAVVPGVDTAKVRQAVDAAFANPAGLTARELEVLALLADGLTNAQLADRLFLSAKTVDHHVSSVLRKLGEPNRAAAAAAARQRGLLPNMGNAPDVRP